MRPLLGCPESLGPKVSSPASALIVVGEKETNSGIQTAKEILK